MLSAIIRSPGPPEPLAATLAVLIAAVTEGFVGHAVVVAPPGTTDVAALADATGADLVFAADCEAWALGAAAARGDWVLLLDAGDIPDIHWVRSVERHLLLSGQMPALLPRGGMVDALVERVARLAGPRTLAAGIVATRAQASAGVLAATPARLSATRTLIRS